MHSYKCYRRQVTYHRGLLLDMLRDYHVIINCYIICNPHHYEGGVILTFDKGFIFSAGWDAHSETASLQQQDERHHSVCYEGSEGLIFDINPCLVLETDVIASTVPRFSLFTYNPTFWPLSLENVLRYILNICVTC